MSVLIRPVNPSMSRQMAAGACMDTLPQAFDMTSTCEEFDVDLVPMRVIAEREAGQRVTLYG
jgi:hypothetical protein